MIPLSSLKQGMTAVVISGVGGQQDTLTQQTWVLIRVKTKMPISIFRKFEMLRKFVYMDENLINLIISVFAEIIHICEKTGHLFKLPRPFAPVLHIFLRKSAKIPFDSHDADKFCLFVQLKKSEHLLISPPYFRQDFRKAVNGKFFVSTRGWIG